jgi:hypothetical protein
MQESKPIQFSGNRISMENKIENKIKEIISQPKQSQKEADLNLSINARESRAVAFVNNLDCVFFQRQCILRQSHFSHTAFAQRPLDYVMAEIDFLLFLRHATSEIQEGVHTTNKTELTQGRNKE